MKYAYLDADQQAGLLRQRLLQLEGEHYQHELNKSRMERLIVSGTKAERTQAEAALAEIKAAQKVLEAAHRVDSAALEALDGGNAADEEPKAKRRASNAEAVVAALKRGDGPR